MHVLVGRWSSVHVSSVVSRIVVVSAVVVGSNTSIESSVKQGVSSAAGSTAVWQCKLVSSLSILSWKKRENVSQPSFFEQNPGSYIWWTSNDLRM